MAVYDGFFDAVLDEETGEYDRAYNSGDFTTYFDKIVGSGVCIHNNPDSFKVRFADGNAVIALGYLFIQGYWLKNDADYSIPLAGTDGLAVVAHLNLGKRMIELEAVPTAQNYPDSLVLALVNPADNTVEDTRHNTDICGVIDSAGELSKKVEWAVSYIDNEIETKLAQVEKDIAEQAERLDAKVAEAQQKIDSIVPDPIGTIKFSAAQNVGEDWLLCNGDFISENQYPELVAALGKLTPSGDKFKLISEGEVAPQISNGAVYNGRMWVYSYSSKKLYGVDIEESRPVKEVSLSSENKYFDNFVVPSVAKPLCLSILPHKVGTGAKLFLSQIVQSGGVEANSGNLAQFILVFDSEFSGEESSVEMAYSIPTFTNKVSLNVDSNVFVPYITSRVESGVEVYSCAFGVYRNAAYTNFVSYFDFDGKTAEIKLNDGPTYADDLIKQRVSFKGNLGEIVSIYTKAKNSGYEYSVNSGPNDLFMLDGTCGEIKSRVSPCPLNIAGSSKILTSFDLHNLIWFSYLKSSAKSVDPQISLPSSARVFVDSTVYLWGKDIYMIFVGTGIIFSRTLEEGSFGYLDTTSVLGTITQFGYLDYAQDEGTLYLLGQDTTNTVKVAKIVLNTLYDYANDGAWLPMIASDGVPAYIKARGKKVIGDPVDINVKVLSSATFDQSAYVTFEGESLIQGTYTRTASKSGSFEVGICLKKDLSESSLNKLSLKINNNKIISGFYGKAGETKTLSFKTADYLQSGVTLEGGA